MLKFLPVLLLVGCGPLFVEPTPYQPNPGNAALAGQLLQMGQPQVLAPTPRLTTCYQRYPYMTCY